MISDHDSFGGVETDMEHIRSQDSDVQKCDRAYSAGDMADRTVQVQRL